jgi:hypothetical protein
LAVCVVRAVITSSAAAAAGKFGWCWESATFWGEPVSPGSYMRPPPVLRPRLHNSLSFSFSFSSLSPARQLHSVSVALFYLSFFAFSFEQQSSAHTTFI